MTPAGFPHSDISGSKCVCHSPELFAAYHVLHRLLSPRHPPCALSSFTEFRCSLGAYPSLLLRLSKISRGARAPRSSSRGEPRESDTSLRVARRSLPEIRCSRISGERGRLQSLFRFGGDNGDRTRNLRL